MQTTNTSVFNKTTEIDGTVIGSGNAIKVEHFLSTESPLILKHLRKCRVNTKNQTCACYFKYIWAEQ
jgi:hypothetical protein